MMLLSLVEFAVGARVAGESKYNFRKLLKFSIHTLCSFSDFPLKLGLYSGAMAAAAGVIFTLYSMIQKLFCATPAGYAAIIAALCFLSALISIVIGIIGKYISILFAEVKNRSIYIVSNTQNLMEAGKGENDNPH